MIDRVQIQWERDALRLKPVPANGRTVRVKFVMNAEGKITEIKSVEPDVAVGDGPTRACINAIVDRAPYGVWTDDMKAVLGSQQEMTFTFYYQ